MKVFGFIDNEQKVLEIKGLEKKRLMVFQSKEIENEWEKIRLQHKLLAKEGIANCNLPLKGNGSPIFQLAHLQNLEAMITYSDWMDEELDETFRSFLPDRTDEYQLEARIKDFRHEVHHTLLQDAKKNIAEALQLEESVENEKRILRGQLVMERSIETGTAALKKVEEGMGKIQEAHPELLQVRCSAATLVVILEHFKEWHLGKGTLWTQFLHNQLGVFTVISGHFSHWVLALRRGMHRLYSSFSQAEILDMLQNFDSYLVEANRLFVEKGAEEFHFQFYRGAGRLQPLITLRNFIYEECKGKRPPPFMYPFLPPYRIEGKKALPLMKFDPETYEPNFFIGQ